MQTFLASIFAQVAEVGVFFAAGVAPRIVAPNAPLSGADAAAGAASARKTTVMAVTSRTGIHLRRAPAR